MQQDRANQIAHEVCIKLVEKHNKLAMQALQADNVEVAIEEYIHITVILDRYYNITGQVLPRVFEQFVDRAYNLAMKQEVNR